MRDDIKLFKQKHLMARDAAAVDKAFAELGAGFDQEFVDQANEVIWHGSLEASDRFYAIMNERCVPHDFQGEVNGKLRLPNGFAPLDEPTAQPILVSSAAKAAKGMSYWCG